MKNKTIIIFMVLSCFLFLNIPLVDNAKASELVYCLDNFDSYNQGQKTGASDHWTYFSTVQASAYPDDTRATSNNQSYYFDEVGGDIDVWFNLTSTFSYISDIRFDFYATTLTQTPGLTFVFYKNGEVVLDLRMSSILYAKEWDEDYQVVDPSVALNEWQYVRVTHKTGNEMRYRVAKWDNDYTYADVNLTSADTSASTWTTFDKILVNIDAGGNDLDVWIDNFNITAELIGTYESGLYGEYQDCSPAYNSFSGEGGVAVYNNRYIEFQAGYDVNMTLNAFSLLVGPEMAHVYTDDFGEIPFNTNSLDLYVNGEEVGVSPILYPSDIFSGYYDLVYSGINMQISTDSLVLELVNDLPVMYNTIGSDLNPAFWVLGAIESNIEPQMKYHNTGVWLGNGIVNGYTSGYSPVFCLYSNTQIIPIINPGFPDSVYVNDNLDIYANKTTVPITYSLSVPSSSYIRIYHVETNSYVGSNQGYAGNGMEVSGFGFGGVVHFVPLADGKYIVNLTRNGAVVDSCTFNVTESGDSFYLTSLPPSTYPGQSYTIRYKYDSTTTGSLHYGLTGDVSQSAYYTSFRSGTYEGNVIIEGGSLKSTYWFIIASLSNGSTGYVPTGGTHKHLVLNKFASDEINALYSLVQQVTDLPQRFIGHHNWYGAEVRIIDNGIVVSYVGYEPEFNIVYTSADPGTHYVYLQLYLNETWVNLASDTYQVITMTGHPAQDEMFGMPGSVWWTIVGLCITMFFFFLPSLVSQNFRHPIPKEVNIFCGTGGLIACVLFGFFPIWVVFVYALLIVVYIVLKIRKV